MTSRKPLGEEIQNPKVFCFPVAVRDDAWIHEGQENFVRASDYARLLSMLTPPPDAEVREAVEKLGDATYVVASLRDGCYAEGKRLLGVLLRAVQSPKLEPSSEDREDEYTEAISAAHPLKTKHHELHDLAMKMVGNRHSKAALVELVNWLLAEREKPRLTGEQREAVKDMDKAATQVRDEHLRPRQERTGTVRILTPAIEKLRAAFGLGEV